MLTVGTYITRHFRCGWRYRLSRSFWLAPHPGRDPMVVLCRSKRYLIHRCKRQELVPRFAPQFLYLSITYPGAISVSYNLAQHFTIYVNQRIISDKILVISSRLLAAHRPCSKLFVSLCSKAVGTQLSGNWLLSIGSTSSLDEMSRNGNQPITPDSKAVDLDVVSSTSLAMNHTWARSYNQPCSFGGWMTKI